VVKNDSVLYFGRDPTMADLLIRAIGIALAAGLALLGRWVYSHPKRFLEKLEGVGESHGTFRLRSTKFAGAVWLFVAIYGIFSGLFGSLAARVVPTPLLVGIFVALSALISRRLLRQRRAHF
jgi:hypothetical protein